MARNGLVVDKGNDCGLEVKGSWVWIPLLAKYSRLAHNGLGFSKGSRYELEPLGS